MKQQSCAFWRNFTRPDPALRFCVHLLILKQGVISRNRCRNLLENSRAFKRNSARLTLPLPFIFNSFDFRTGIWSNAALCSENQWIFLWIRRIVSVHVLSIFQGSSQTSSDLIFRISSFGYRCSLGHVKSQQVMSPDHLIICRGYHLCAFHIFLTSITWLLILDDKSCTSIIGPYLCTRFISEIKVLFIEISSCLNFRSTAGLEKIITSSEETPNVYASDLESESL